MQSAGSSTTHLPPEQTRKSAHLSVGAQASPFFFSATQVCWSTPVVSHESPASQVTCEEPHVSPAFATFFAVQVFVPVVSQ